MLESEVDILALSQEIHGVPHGQHPQEEEAETDYPVANELLFLTPPEHGEEHPESYQGEGEIPYLEGYQLSRYSGADRRPIMTPTDCFSVMRPA